METRQATEEIANVSQTISEMKDPTLALFAQWEHEDDGKSPEDTEAEDRLWQEFEQGINATRQAQEMRRL